MKNKRLFGCIVAAIVAFACCFAVGCAKPEDKGADVVALTSAQNNVVVLTAHDTVPEGKTLLDGMQFLKSENQLTFTISDGMITAINGTAQTTNSYWMLYTDDAENSDSSWGEYTYNSTTYYSAKVGANALPVKADCVYIWVYQTF